MAWHSLKYDRSFIFDDSTLPADHPIWNFCIQDSLVVDETEIHHAYQRLTDQLKDLQKDLRSIMRTLLKAETFEDQNILNQAFQDFHSEQAWLDIIKAKESKIWNPSAFSPYQLQGVFFLHPKIFKKITAYEALQIEIKQSLKKIINRYRRGIRQAEKSMNQCAEFFDYYLNREDVFDEAESNSLGFTQEPEERDEYSETGD